MLEVQTGQLTERTELLLFVFVAWGALCLPVPPCSAVHAIFRGLWSSTSGSVSKQRSRRASRALRGPKFRLADRIVPLLHIPAKIINID